MEAAQTKLKKFLDVKFNFQKWINIELHTYIPTSIVRRLLCYIQVNLKDYILKVFSYIFSKRIPITQSYWMQ
jgi:predicted nucleotidyltransferase